MLNRSIHSSLLFDLWRRYGFEAALGVVITAVVRVLAGNLDGARGAAAAFVLFLWIIVPLTCLTAFWGALVEATILSRAGRAMARVSGLYFCIVLPASADYHAVQAHVEVLLAKWMAIVFIGTVIPAALVRLTGWRLRAPLVRQEDRASRAHSIRQFQLLDLFRVLTVISVWMALAMATRRAYGTTPEDFLLFDHLWIKPSFAMLGAAVIGTGALGLFCLWFREVGRGRAWLLLSHFAAWMAIMALTFAIGSVLNLDAGDSSYWLVLGMWGILFLPMTIASHVSQARGWRLVRATSRVPAAATD